MDTYHKVIGTLIPDVDFHQNHFARALDRIVVGGDWLDLGAGTKIHDGYKVAPQEELARRVRSLVGIDPHAEHLKDNPYLTRAVSGSGEQLPFDAASFDIVSANMVLEHLEHPEAVFREVARVLRPGGAFCFVTPNVEHPFIAVSHLFLSRSSRSELAVAVEGRPAEHVFPTFYRANRRSTLRAQMRDVGLAEESLVVHRNIPFLRHPTPALIAESLFIKLCAIPPFDRFGADLVGVFRRAK